MLFVFFPIWAVYLNSKKEVVFIKKLYPFISICNPKEKHVSEKRSKSKNIKEKGRKLHYIVFLLAIIFIIAIIYAVVILTNALSGGLGPVGRFFIDYIWYIIAGVIILTAILFILNYMDRKRNN